MALGDIAVEERAEVHLVVAFVDLAGYAAQAARIDDHALAAAMDGWYERVAAQIAAAGGRTVKFIGDAALIVFDGDRADDAVTALLALKDDADAYFAGVGWDVHAYIKVHAGPCIAGAYGAAGDKRFDVLGRTVNAAAMLDCTGVTLSAEAFRALSPESQRRFKEHSAPATYIGLEDSPRFRRR
jgi:adenylate cyclase